MPHGKARVEKQPHLAGSLKWDYQELGEANLETDVKFEIAHACHVFWKCYSSVEHLFVMWETLG